MHNFVTQYIKGCATCQMNKVNTHPTKPVLYPITSTPDAWPFETIALDFIVKLPLSNGYDTILTITDHDCLKATIFIPCNETVDSEGVVKLYAQHVIPHYGLPWKVISDRDTWFTSNFTKELCHVLGVKQNISTVYHPQTDGQSKCTNQSLEQYLHIICREHQSNWADWLPLAQYVWNLWPLSTMKKTPYELILSYTPHMHQLVWATTVSGVTDHLQQITKNWASTQEALKCTQEKMIKETKYAQFKVSEQVWLEGTHLKLPYETMKIASQHYGPFIIMEKIPDIAYRLKLPEKWKIHNIFHMSLLTPYTETEKHSLNFLKPSPDLIDGEEEWEVKQILNDWTYWCKKQYLVQWRGYALEHNSWVDKSELHVPDLLKDYRQQSRTRLMNIIQRAIAKTP